jgi:hypothetical protein
MKKTGETVEAKVFRVYGKCMKAFLKECYNENLSPIKIAKKIGADAHNIRRILRLHGFSRFVEPKPMVKYTENPLFDSTQVNLINVLSKNWI